MGWRDYTSYYDAIELIFDEDTKEVAKIPDEVQRLKDPCYK